MPWNLAAQSGTIWLGAGCFWTSEAVFERLPGVLDVENGYAKGGMTFLKAQSGRVLPDYQGWIEVVRIEYDPARISIAQILAIFFLAHDPFSLDAQGEDRGPRYRSVLFVEDASLLAYLQDFAQSLPEGIATVFGRLSAYRPAKAEDQNFFAQNPDLSYCRTVIVPRLNSLGLFPWDWDSR